MTIIPYHTRKSCLTGGKLYVHSPLASLLLVSDLSKACQQVLEIPRMVVLRFYGGYFVCLDFSLAGASVSCVLDVLNTHKYISIAELLEPTDNEIIITLDSLHLFQDHIFSV